MRSTSCAPGAERRRSARRAAAAGSALFLALLAGAPGPARAGLFAALAGVAPPDSGAISEGAGLDSVDVDRLPDFGFSLPAEYQERLAGGRAALLDVEGPTRPPALSGPGWGRTAVELDGFPVGGGPVRWEPDGWLPTRALASFRARPDVAGEGLAALDVVTRRGPLRPASTVTLTGGSFGHRLSELQFGRVFGRVSVQADAALLRHGGFAAFGALEQSRGFLRADFPGLGGEFLLLGQLASGHNDYYDVGASTGREDGDDSRIGLGWSRADRGGRWTARLLRESSRIETVDTGLDDFALERGRWWGRIERTLADSTGVVNRIRLTAARDRRDGLLDAGRTLSQAGASFRHERPLGGRFRLDAELDGGYREPTGWRLDGRARLTHGDAFASRWLEAATSSVAPAVLFHLDRAVPDAARLAGVIERLEGLDAPETHRALRGGLARAAADGRLSLAIDGAALRSDRVQPTLSAAAAAPLAPASGPRWSGELRVWGAWRPSTTLEVGLNGGLGFFDSAEDPRRPQALGDGWLRLRRSYFQGDLEVTGTALGRLVGERRTAEGLVLPAVVTGRVELAARIRTMTLFWRMENPFDQYLESDLLDAGGLPIAVPGRHYRFGATLRLLD